MAFGLSFKSVRGKDDRGCLALDYPGTHPPWWRARSLDIFRRAFDECKSYDAGVYLESGERLKCFDKCEENDFCETVPDYR